MDSVVIGYFIFCGITVNFIASIALMAFLGGAAIEYWIKFNDFRKIFLQWYSDHLKSGRAKG